MSMQIDQPKWITPERQTELVRLFRESKGLCVVTHKPCHGKYVLKGAPVCKWGLSCNNPLTKGATCDKDRRDNKGNTITVPCDYGPSNVTRWHCGWGDFPCYSALVLDDEVFGGKVVIGELVYKEYMKILIHDWQALDRDAETARWNKERSLMHTLGETNVQLRGRFSDISRDIYHGDQPVYLITGYSVMFHADKTAYPVANVRLTSSNEILTVDITSAVKDVSKNARNKAIRYGKPLPEQATFEIEKLCSKAVREAIK